MKIEDYVEILKNEIKRQNAWDKYYQVAVMTDGGIETFDCHAGNPAHDSYSVAKSITAMGLGLLYDKGLVDINAPVTEYLGEFISRDREKWEKITLADIMHHSYGAEYGVDFDIVNANLWEKHDWLETLLSIPIVKDRGQEFMYSDGNYYIIGRIMEKITGEDAEKTMEKGIFLPLGFHQNAWSRDNSGHTVCGTGLYMRTQDMCKLAWLQLNDGVWEGQRILSHEWIELMKKPELCGYGFGVSTLGDDKFGAGGMYGQGYFYNVSERMAAAWHSFDTDGLIDVCSHIR